MENENMCFFSISLENGIIITGNSPKEVHDFLHNMCDAFYYQAKHYREVGLDCLKENSEEDFHKAAKALETLHKHLNK